MTGVSQTSHDEGTCSVGPVLLPEDHEALERLLGEAKRVMLTEKEILAAQQSQKEAIRTDADLRYHELQQTLRDQEASREELRRGLELARSRVRNPAEELRLEQERIAREESFEDRHQRSVRQSAQRSEHICARTQGNLRASLNRLGAERHDTCDFLDRQKALRMEHAAKFTDAYREVQLAPPQDRHRRIAEEALHFVRRAQAIDRYRRGERPDAATYLSLTGGDRKSPNAAYPKKKDGSSTASTTATTNLTSNSGFASISTSPRGTRATRIAACEGLKPTVGRPILQPSRPLDSWELRQLPAKRSPRRPAAAAATVAASDTVALHD